MKTGTWEIVAAMGTLAVSVFGVNVNVSKITTAQLIHQTRRDS